MLTLGPTVLPTPRHADHRTGVQQAACYPAYILLRMQFAVASTPAVHEVSQRPPHKPPSARLQLSCALHIIYGSYAESGWLT